MATAMDRSGGGGTYAAGVRRPRSRLTGRVGGGEDNHERDSASQGDNIGPIDLKKNVCNDDRDSEGLRRWRSVTDDRAEDDANDDNFGERGATAADDRDNVGNGKEDRIDDDDGGGNGWG